MKAYDYYYEDERKKAAKKFDKLDGAVLVSQDGDMYDIISKTAEPVFEYTKRKLDFDDARYFLTDSYYPVIFCGVDPVNIEALMDAPSDYMEPKKSSSLPFFVETSDSILKVALDIPEEDLKTLIRDAYDAEWTQEASRVFYVPFEDFFQNEGLYKAAKFPLILNVYEDLLLPYYVYEAPSLFYALNALYRGKGTIDIDVSDLENVYKATTEENRDIVGRFTNMLSVNVLEKYNKEELQNHRSYMVDLSRKEKVDMTDSLSYMKYMVQSGSKNKETLSKLNIDPERAMKEKAGPQLKLFQK